MRYSIITPTLARPTLKRLCVSIAAQTAENWEHLIAVDVPLIVRPDARAVIESLPKDDRRKIFRCGKQHRNYGNTCRHNTWAKASGDYILYLDDDNFLADPDALKRLDAITGEWAIFPMLRFGSWFYNDPPSFGTIDTANMLVKREHAQWPDLNDDWQKDYRYSQAYPADWKLAERLMQTAAYQAFPDMQPVVIMEMASKGQ